MGNFSERSRRLILIGGGQLNEQTNVYNRPLQACSHAQMARTGFSRDAMCRTSQDDQGSHNVCLDLESAPGFCSRTNQSDWCRSSMPCHHDRTKQCPVKNWCVCEWAFESYLDDIKKEKGHIDCKNMGRIKCDATNRAVLDHYKNNQSNPKTKQVLQCLQQQCNLN